jgi:hypothetical protein
LSSADLTGLARYGASPAGPSPLPAVEPAGGDAIEVDRSVSNAGIVSLAGRQVLAAEILRGCQVTIRIERATLLCFDPDTRELLRARPNQLTPEQAVRLQGARPAGPPPRPRTEPVTVQRRVSTTGTITVCRQTVALGRSPRPTHRHRPRLRAHARDRARQRDPNRPPHDHQPRRRHQGQPPPPACSPERPTGPLSERRAEGTSQQI